MQSPNGIDFAKLHRTLLLALGLYVTSAVLAYLQAYVLAGIVQRTMSRLRTEVEEKLNRLPLRDVDRMPRGDLLSRVTNDIDNLAQSLQQTLSQMLTSVLTVVGVMVMMISISPLLALVAIVTIPVSLFTISFITRRSKPRFVAQWDHTGTLNAQVEEVFTGHELVKVFGRQHDAEADLRRRERRTVRGELRRPVHLGDDPADDDVHRQSELRRHRGDRRVAGRLRLA